METSSLYGSEGLCGDFGSSGLLQGSGGHVWAAYHPCHPASAGAIVLGSAQCDTGEQKHVMQGLKGNAS